MTTLHRRRALATARALAGAVALASCRTSPPPQAVPQATSPYGAHSIVTLVDGKTFDGEVLAITDSSWILMVGDRVASVRDGAISNVRVADLGELRYADGGRPSASELHRARRVTRFPYGIAPEAMAALLAKSTQSSPDDLETRRP
jgi:hypothetical protein